MLSQQPSLEDAGQGLRLVPSEPVEAVTEAHHRIANNLSVISGFVQMQAAEAARRTEPLNGTDVGFLLQETASRIDMVSRLHRLLSKAPDGESIDLGDHLRQICQSLIYSLSFGRSTELTLELDSGCRVSAGNVLSISLIVSEIATNSIKYAHPSGVAGKLAVGCRRQPGGALEVTVADDGVGLPENFDPHVDGGFGYRLVRMLTEQLGGSCLFENGDLGLTFRLRVPQARA